MPDIIMTWPPEIPSFYRNKIQVGDCRELSPNLPDECVDIVFTSPPYNCGMKYKCWNDQMDEEDFWSFQGDWIREAFRLCRPSGRMYVTLTDEMIWRLRPLAEDVGWTFHQVLIWCKPNLAPGAKRMRGDWTYLTEICLLFHKGKRTSMLGGPLGVNTHNWITATAPQTQFKGFNHRVYPAQMAVPVAFAWLSRTPGSIVYEPFAGSGTTLIACKQLGKNFIAFEIDPEAVSLAEKRLAEIEVKEQHQRPKQLRLR